MEVVVIVSQNDYSMRASFTPDDVSGKKNASDKWNYLTIMLILTNTIT
ncbi:hypothetical protein [Neobacillus mesonae]|nr:hypothetical protein [Neobacillus mesonae]